MRIARARWVPGAATIALAAAMPPTAHPQTAARVSVLIDSSGSMLQTPEIVTFPETCVAQNFNPCTSTSANPTIAQETCNACAAWTARNFNCDGNDDWDATC